MLQKSRVLQIPRTHNLIRLHKICEDLIGGKLGIDREMLIFLNDVYIDSRYPADFGILPSGQSGEKEGKQACSYANAINALLRSLIKEHIDRNSYQKD